MNNEKYIATKLRELRKNAGLDVDTVGEGVGRSGKTVSAWETGRNVPSAEMLISICRFFGVSISYFDPSDVGDDASAQSELSPATRELLDICSKLNEQQIEILVMNARQFAVANEKDGGRDSEDVERFESVVI